MENIEKYIEEIKEYIKRNPDITEETLIRYVFLDLAKKLSFDINFIPFGNSKTKQRIYKESFGMLKVDEALKSRIIICNSASKILELVLKSFGVNIRSVPAKNDIRKCPHVYNIVTPKSGEEEYIVDLQEDMYQVKMHGRTPNYGISERTGKYVISFFEQEQMDRKIGYIDNNNYYTDDYLYLLKSAIMHMDNLYDKLKIVLENIEVLENTDLNYIDRQWYHVRILESLFDKTEFNYMDSLGNIKIVDCYKDFEGNKKPINCVCLEDKEGTHIFLYNRQKYNYQEINIDNFVKAVENGLVLHRSTIREVEKKLKLKRKN